MQYTGARIVIECLKEQGVDTIFGYPGGTILNIYDELYKNSDSIKHILTAHEQGAAHAADGYARSSGKTGVCFATSGPGATNLVTGIATAYMDSVPMVAITCNVATPLLGRDSFQEVDITGITMSITKHNYIVRKVEDLADIIREAFAIAKSGRPGPVLIDIPKEVTAAVTEYTPMNLFEIDSKVLDKEIKDGKNHSNANRITKVNVASDEEIAAAAKAISEAKCPFLYVGGGAVIAEAEAQVLELAEKCNIPVSVSLMGKTAFDAGHPLCVGMIGMHGTKAANMAANQCDLLIALGARFSDRVISDASKFAKNSKVLHIDIDPAEVNKNIHADYSVIGDLKEVLTRIIPLVAARKADSWNDDVAEWKKHLPPMYTRKLKLHPKTIFETIHQTLGEKAIITTEVGQHQMWAAQFFPFSKPRSFLTSGGLGTMGYGTGAAMGAQVANPDRYVVHIAGDGSFRMNCNELATISYYNLPIVIIVVNNGTLGMVRQWQNLFYGQRFSQTTLDRGPDFVKLAESYGIRGFRAENEDEFKKAFEQAVSLSADGRRTPALIDTMLNIDEMVLPMVPAGKPIDQLLLEAGDN
ncbi:MAG: biosynthetic-type acetolactate synthase large subunit [Treponemataceae bacterium]|nr:biosynthetic-type acetolactate synthase large subunit [Treponemataceae bacterium]